MTIEQKAQRYDEAIERVKTKLTNEVASEIFPELKESEDEKWIPKEIAKYLKEKGGFRSCWIAWLEKQGVQKPTDEPKDFNSIDPYFGKPQGNSALEAIKEEKVDNSNKVEPNFKVGDWVVNNNGEPQVSQVTARSWPDSKIKRIEDILELPINTATLEKQYHLWTIQDAKDGDVLAEDDNLVVIYHSMCDRKTINVHCCVDNEIFIFGNIGVFEHEDLYPATKEQRDLLFSKMKEAGYKWNASEKKLEKIEQKPAEWSEEDETYSDHVITAIKSYYTDDKGKENPWREELLRWLKSLKNRVQPKQEWGEEDENIVCFLINVTENYKIRNGFSSVLEQGNKAIDWLKSLRLHNNWKPSNEQMNAVKDAIDYLGGNTKTVRKYLMSLYEDLKKL